MHKNMLGNGAYITKNEIDEFEDDIISLDSMSLIAMINEILHAKLSLYSKALLYNSILSVIGQNKCNYLIKKDLIWYENGAFPICVWSMDDYDRDYLVWIGDQTQRLPERIINKYCEDNNCWNLVLLLEGTIYHSNPLINNLYYVDIYDVLEHKHEGLNFKTDSNISTHIFDSEKQQSKKVLPDLPSQELPVGKFIRTAMRNIEKSNYKFPDEALKQMCDRSWSRKTFEVAYPFLLKHNKNDDNDYKISGHNRYYADIFVFNGDEYRLTKELYESDKRNQHNKSAFIKWYTTLQNSNKED